MNVNEIQSKIDSYYYWDARVRRFECNYFADEVIIVYEADKGIDVTYRFNFCYKVAIDHVVKYDKLIPVKDMTKLQLPYYLQDVLISEIDEENVSLYQCQINMFPLEVEIWCKEIEVVRGQLH